MTTQRGLFWVRNIIKHLQRILEFQIILLDHIRTKWHLNYVMVIAYSHENEIPSRVCHALKDFPPLTSDKILSIGDESSSKSQFYLCLSAIKVVECVPHRRRRSLEPSISPRRPRRCMYIRLAISYRPSLFPNSIGQEIISVSGIRIPKRPYPFPAPFRYSNKFWTSIFFSHSEIIWRGDTIKYPCACALSIEAGEIRKIIFQISSISHKFRLYNQCF